MPNCGVPVSSAVGPLTAFPSEADGNWSTFRGSLLVNEEQSIPAFLFPNCPCCLAGGVEELKDPPS